jgi:hypothetical protein
MQFWIPLLGGALGAAIINGLFSFYKIRHDAALEHGQWRRDLKFEAYKRFFESIHEFSVTTQGLKNGSIEGVTGAQELEASYEKMVTAQTLFSLVCPPQALDTINAVSGASGDLLAACIGLHKLPSTETQEAYVEAQGRFRSSQAELMMMCQRDLGLLPGKPDAIGGDLDALTAAWRRREGGAAAQGE